MTIRIDRDPAADEVRPLLLEYAGSLSFDLCFQDFERELAGLPGDYAPPDGALLLARVDGAPAGCVALRRLGGTAGELKRLYVRPGHRGLGLGRALAESAITTARELGYGQLRLDTTPEMAAAHELYRTSASARSRLPAEPDRGYPLPRARARRLSSPSRRRSRKARAFSRLPHERIEHQAREWFLALSMNAHSQSEARQAFSRDQEPSAIAPWTAITIRPSAALTPSASGVSSPPPPLEAELDPCPPGGVVEDGERRLGVDLDTRVREQELAQRLAQLDGVAQVALAGARLPAASSLRRQPAGEVGRRRELLALLEQLPRIHEIPYKLRRRHRYS